MSDLGDRSSPGLLESTSSVACAAPRRIGENVLLAPLGDDALGSVYRALDTFDGRFVRLRVLQSPELPPSAVLEAAQRQIERNAAFPPGGGPRHGDLRIADDGTPYFVWPETNGWTLDFVLARARAGGWGMPTEFALWIAKQAAAEIEQTSFVATVGEPAYHGAVWPGFVSISSDAEVHVEGFGLSEAILPYLAKPRIWRDVAPYIAPEVRRSGRADGLSDVYSIGVLLTELLTGQRASADTQPPNWRADDEFSGEMSLTLRFALAHPVDRFASISQLHASLKQLVSLCPFETTPADLALFLYDLLNLENQALPAPFDGNSTNPVFVDQPKTDFTASSPKSFFLLSSPPDGPPDQRKSLSASRRSAMSVVAFPTGRASSYRLLRWSGRAAALIAAFAALLFLWLPARTVVPPPTRVAEGISPAAPSMASGNPSPIIIPEKSASPVRGLPEAPSQAAPSKPRSPREIVHARRLAKDHSAAETLRLKAALARIGAERLDAPAHAAETFRQGRSQEQAGQRLLSRLDYAAARDAYAQALDFFTESEARSREERMRQISIAGAGR